MVLTIIKENQSSLRVDCVLERYTYMYIEVDIHAELSDSITLAVKYFDIISTCRCKCTVLL